MTAPGFVPMLSDVSDAFDVCDDDDDDDDVCIMARFEHTYIFDPDLWDTYAFVPPVKQK